jgi:hypothetical protein
MTDANNTTANYAVVGEPYDDNAILQDPTWLLQVTHFWGTTTLGQPVSGVTHDHSIGVRYVNGQWAIFNEDQAPMPAGVRFAIKLAHPGIDAYGHFALSQTATAANTQDDYTMIDDPHTNGISNVRLFVTQDLNPGGSGGGIYNNHPIGVFYVQGKWAIFNEDMAPMPIGAAFNVMVDAGGTTTTLVHQATSANTSAYATLVSDVSAGSFDAQTPMFLTQLWITGKSGIGGPALGVYNPNHTGVFFTSQGQWSIFNEDQAAMPLGAAFNIGVL